MRLADEIDEAAMAEVTVEEVHLAMRATATALVKLNDEAEVVQVAGLGAFEHLGAHLQPTWAWSGAACASCAWCS